MTFFSGLEHLYALGLSAVVLYQNWDKPIIQKIVGFVKGKLGA